MVRSHAEKQALLTHLRKQSSFPRKDKWTASINTVLIFKRQGMQENIVWRSGRKQAIDMLLYISSLSY